MDRREFLKKTLFLTAGTMIGSKLLASPSDWSELLQTRRKKQVGLQLYSLRNRIGNDVPGTLKLVSDMGYTTLETASYRDGKLYNMDPKEFRKMAEDLGMKVTGAHLGQNYSAEREQEVMDWWKVALDTQVAAGCKYAVQPSFPIGKTLGDIKSYCDYFNKVGALAKQRGLLFGFHNHAGEFAEIDGKVIFDYMIENTDPALVMFELDVYWAQRGGKSPVEYIKKYGKTRIPLLHIKDECAIGESGDIDFKPIFDAAYANGMKEFYVEVERYTVSPEDDVKRSFVFLNSAAYVK